MTVFAHQYGRRGNNMFQQAAAIGYATKHGLDYSICPWYAKNNILFGNAVILKEQGHQYQELPFIKAWKGRNIVLDGYFQSAKYFDHCREEVLKVFGYTWTLTQGRCSIHVRRGDYLLYPDKHPVVDTYYLTTAIGIIQKTGCHKFLVFSDDIPWCKQFFEPLATLFNITIEYSEGRTPEEDLILGSCCEHNIISNSTFSWWQAWLNQNPNKIVISPSKDNWFGEGNAALCTDDIIPKEWIQIKY